MYTLKAIKTLNPLKMVGVVLLSPRPAIEAVCNMFTIPVVVQTRARGGDGGSEEAGEEEEEE